MRRRQARSDGQPFDFFEALEASGPVNFWPAGEWQPITAERWQAFGLPIMRGWEAEWRGDYPAHRDSPPWPFLLFGPPDGWRCAPGDRYRALVAAVELYERRAASPLTSGEGYGQDPAAGFLAELRAALADMERPLVDVGTSTNRKDRHR